MNSKKVKLENGLTISTPGRICLFGEHQDYLQLPVISAAISLRIAISGARRNDSAVRISLPDIRDELTFSLGGELPYVLERDYFRSGVNILRRNGFTFSRGFDCTVRGKIPIRAGTSSSSALVVSWIQFLALMSDQHSDLRPEICARYAHSAEVVEFGEPGGMMDQYATSYGGILFIEFSPEISIKKLMSPLKTFVLGDSQETKDTKLILSRVKNRVLEIVRSITKKHNKFTLRSVRYEDIERYGSELDTGEYRILQATVRNRDITYKALKLLDNTPFDVREFGGLLNEHQRILRDVLRISTTKIDNMLDAALGAGAYGGKINGSGGGGCMFVYAPEKPDMIAEAIEKTGGRSYIIHIDEGIRIEKSGYINE